MWVQSFFSEGGTVANTESKNFRCEQTKWDTAMAKAATMRSEGYDIDVSKLLNTALDVFNAEDMGKTAKRLKLVKGDGPAPLYRRPAARSAK
jgi:hypothetical protein